MIAKRVDVFVRETIVPYKRDDRRGSHGPPDALVQEMRALSGNRGLLTPHIRADGSHLSHRGTAPVLRAADLSPLNAYNQ